MPSKSKQTSKLLKNIMIEVFMSSVSAYVKKTEKQSTQAELTADLQVTMKAQEEMRKNIVQIKNILAAPAVKPTEANSLFYAQVLQKPYLLRTSMQLRPSSGLHEILIKIENTVSESEIQIVSEEIIKEKINKTLEKSQVQNLKSVKTLAVKQHSSEDITLYTNDQDTTRKMQIYKKK
ncbi:hypothetical protein PAAG_06716 [Paracoccidioides lutzii Pb01]|uniref:Uncharacterized protein n=1 Tax=Paracoccidioides lutzii (strain ATCC MYA-826 / Pb01) TaxID=502779 RepID=C1H7H5_PARBA|nr:hypothetical protein PAAG_06716 [Paracoccidioides lutzii Pb01]EEH35669.2 hypothetical protein PAAG_06716 [Paracoccidioides lutzii Pb01]